MTILSLSIKKPIKFKHKGIRYNCNFYSGLLNDLAKLMTLGFGPWDGLINKLFIKRNKLITIERWTTARECKSDHPASDSEDEKRMC